MDEIREVRERRQAEQLKKITAEKEKAESLEKLVELRELHVGTQRPELLIRYKGALDQQKADELWMELAHCLDADCQLTVKTDEGKLLWFLCDSLAPAVTATQQLRKADLEKRYGVLIMLTLIFTDLGSLIEPVKTHKFGVWT